MTEYNEPIDIYTLGPVNSYHDPTTAQIVSDFYERRIWPGPNAIALAGEARGARTEWVGNVSAVSSIGDKELLIFAHRNTESVVGSLILRDKDLTRKLLSAAGVPVAEGRAVASAEEAIVFQQELGVAVVVKPRFGSRGKGVSVGLTEPEAVREAFARASEIGSVVVERDLHGVAEYRCLTTPDKCVSVVRRILPWVEGNGLATIEELIDAKNELRRTIPSTFRRAIPKDAVTEATLRRQNLGFPTVLDLGVRVTVRDVGGLSSGGEPEEWSDRVPDSVKQVASASARAIPGLGWCGSDIMIDVKGDPYVVEVNSDADTLGAGYPFYGRPAPVAPLIFDMRFRSAPNVVTNVPKPPVKHPHPSGAVQRETRKGSGSSLTSLLRDRIIEAGAQIDDVSPTIAKVTFPDESVQWLAGTATVDDLSAVRVSAQRHGLARRLIQRKGLPLVRGITSSHADRIERFRAKAPGGTILLTRGRGRWGHRSAKPASSLEEIKDIMGSRKRPWVAQHRVSGDKLRILASPRKALAVFGDLSLSDENLRAASDLAVNVVRAVPGLRWASVDMVIPSTKGGPSGPTVEGVGFDPWLWDSDVLVAGDMESVYATILGRSLA